MHRSRPLAFFNNYIKGKQLLFCTKLWKHKAPHYHMISLVSIPEKEPGGWQKCRQNIPGLPPTPLTPINDPVCTYLSLCRGMPFSEQYQARNFWLTACVKALATCLVLLPKAGQLSTRAHRSSH